MQIHNWQPETILGNKYKIIRMLPEGTTGKCYQVEHFHWNMPLRLKCFSADSFADQQGRYLQHAIDRWISLPGAFNIVSAYCWEDIEQAPCLISEYVDGIALDRYLATVEQVATALDIAIHIGSALDYAHQCLALHGNLKPSNILVTGNGTPLLEDFVGLAQQRRQDSSGNDDLFGIDLRQYGYLLYYLFYGGSFTCEQTPAALDFATSRSWQVPERLEQFIRKLIATGIDRPLASILDSLKQCYEEITGTLYKNAPLLPARLLVEQKHKHAFSYLETGQRERAAKLWGLASDHKPPSVNASWNWYLYHLRRGMVTLDGFISIMEDIDAIAGSHLVCSQAMLALEIGCRINPALEKVRETISNEGASPELVRLEGEIYYRIREFSKAAACFQQLINSKGASGDDWYRLAASHFTGADYDAAITVCTRGLQQNPRHILLQLVEAASRYLQGDPKSEERYQYLAQNYSNTFWVMMHIAEYYAGHGIYQRQVTDAEKQSAGHFYEKVLAINPNIVKAIRGYRRCGQEQMPRLAEYSLSLEGWSEINQLSGHHNVITAVTITPDGRWAASGDCDGNICLWNLESGLCVTRLEGHQKHISDLSFAADGSIVVSASWDRSVRVWDIPSGKCRWLVNDHQDKVSSVAITPDARYFISGGWDGYARIYNIKTQECLAELQPDALWVTDVSIFANAEMAITCDENEEMLLWDTTTQSIRAQMQGITVALSHSENLAVSGGYDRLAFWEIPSGRCLDSIPTQGKEACIAMSADAMLLLTRNEDDILTVWELFNKRRLALLHSEDASCAAMTIDGEFIISGCETVLYLWEDIARRAFPQFHHAYYLPADLRSEWVVPDMIQEMARQAELALFAGDFHKAFTLYNSIKKIPGYEHEEHINSRLIESALSAAIPRKRVKAFRLCQQLTMVGQVTAIAITLAGQIAVVACDDDPIAQWNLQSGYLSHRLFRHSGIVSTLAITPRGDRAISGGGDGRAILWDLNHPGSYQQLELAPDRVTAVAITEDSKRAVVGTDTGRLLFWNLETLSCSELQELPGKVSHIVCRQQYAVAAGNDGQITCWDLEQQKKLGQHHPHGRFITAMDLSTDGTKGISFSRNGSFLIWQADSGEILQEISMDAQDFNEGEVASALKIIDTNFFATACNNGKIRIWEIGAGGCVARTFGGSSKITAMDITPDGRYIVISDEAKELTFYEIEWIWQR